MEGQEASRFHIDRITRKLEEVGISGWRAESAVKKAAKGDYSALTKIMRKHGIDHETVQTVLALAQVAVGVAQIWMSNA